MFLEFLIGNAEKGTYDKGFMEKGKKSILPREYYMFMQYKLHLVTTVCNTLKAGVNYIEIFSINHDNITMTRQQANKHLFFSVMVLMGV